MMVVTMALWRGGFVVRVELAEQSEIDKAEVQGEVFLLQTGSGVSRQLGSQGADRWAREG